VFRRLVPKPKRLESRTRAGDSPVGERGRLTIRHLSRTRHVEASLNLGGPSPKAKYYLVTGVFGVLVAATHMFLLGDIASEGRAFGYVLAIPAIYFSVVRLFSVNSRQGGGDFVTRLVVLGLPATIRTYIGYWLLFIVAGASLQISSGAFWFWFSALPMPLFYIAFFWQIGVGLRAINA